MKSAELYVDITRCLSSCTNTGDNLRPDILLSTVDNTLYIRDLTVSFNANLSNNAHCKEHSYRPITDLAKEYNKKKLLASALGVLAYLVTPLSHFSKCTLKEALKMVITGYHCKPTKYRLPYTETCICTVEHMFVKKSFEDSSQRPYI